MKVIMNVLDCLENWGILICFSVSLIALTLSIITRYVFHPLTWPDELTTYLFILMTFLGASASVKDGMELKVDAIYGMLPRWRFRLDLLLHIVRLGVCATFIYSGWKFVLIEMDMETVTPILLIPRSIVAAMFPFFGFIMAIRSVNCLWQVIREHRQKGL
ncbi:MAG: hypothetical protein BWK80_28210 [Desulfobacteraceae bacterium IS3]|nr:MAG: hypothetical protein BWK80_28210 [Desulfobacteraceae bacterium IS3]